MATAPSVIIGVGGVGSQICAEVERQVASLKETQRNDLPTGRSQEMGNIRFVAIDTDVNSLRALYNDGFCGERILLTENMTVGKCRDIIGDTSIDDWYPSNAAFSNKSMTEGAGQQRSISRLAFEYCIRDGRLSQLDDVIFELNRITDAESSQQTRFYIISSLAGGTGSGIILPLAMYINHFVQREQGDDLAICKGFFILSSAFYTSCDSTLERKSLDANAYAAIKELSSFMRSADAPVSAPRMHYTLQGIDSDNIGFTYDYCYLFGMTNKNSRRVRSFADLRDIVADAVYMQACSPIQGRNNSREDNALRHTSMLGQECQENWLRRFGGIGCGRLIYPYEHLSYYFGLLWAKDTMEKEWQKYDLEYRAARKNSKRNKRGGLRNNGYFDRGEYYISAVDQADLSDQLASFIRLECKKQNSEYPWKLYLDALEAEAAKEISKMMQDYQAQGGENVLDAFKTALVRTEGERTIFPSADRNKERYRNAKNADRLWPRMRSDLGKNKDILMGNSRLFHLHFWDNVDGRNNLLSCYLEYWLVNENGQFFHPNSVRYFLYQTLKELIIRRRRPRESNNLNSPFQPNDKKALSYDEGYKLRKKFEEMQQLMGKEYTEQLVDFFLASCEDYIKRIVQCYEEFYDSYERILDEFDADIEVTEQKLDENRGTNRAYVCADKVCREKLHTELSQRKSYDIGAISAVSYEVFQLMHSNGLEPSKMGTRECANKIKGFWRKGVVREEIGKEILDMDILTAIGKEEECRYDRTLPEQGYERRIENVMETLVAPYLKYFQRLDMNTGISLCCYHSSLKELTGIYRNVVKWLDEKDAVADSSYCRKQEVLFYRSFVGLEPYELLDYLHGVTENTTVRGRAFQSYLDVLGNMGKMEGEESKAVTPHTDRNWHNLNYMPDPSRSYQEEQEHHIAVALLYAWLSGKILKSGGKTKYMFTLDGKRNGNFGRLYDCHLHLYGNPYWCTELCKGMDREIYEARKKGDDSYQIIFRMNQKNDTSSPYDIIPIYQAELYYGERSDSQRWQLAAAVEKIISECSGMRAGMSREAAYLERMKDWSRQTCDNLSCFVSDDQLKEELENFFERYTSMLTERNIRREE